MSASTAARRPTFALTYKGRKDRNAMLSPQLLDLLRQSGSPAGRSNGSATSLHGTELGAPGTADPGLHQAEAGSRDRRQTSASAEARAT